MHGWNCFGVWKCSFVCLIVRLFVRLFVCLFVCLFVDISRSMQTGVGFDAGGGLPYSPKNSSAHQHQSAVLEFTSNGLIK